LTFLASLIRGNSAAAGVSFAGYPLYCGGDERWGPDIHCYKYLNKTWIQVSIEDWAVSKGEFIYNFVQTLISLFF
jgi:hypothetical protein